MKITQTILTSIVTVIVSTSLLYIYEIKSDVDALKKRMDRIEERCSRPTCSSCTSNTSPLALMP